MCLQPVKLFAWHCLPPMPTVPVTHVTIEAWSRVPWWQPVSQHCKVFGRTHELRPCYKRWRNIGEGVDPCIAADASPWHRVIALGADLLRWHAVVTVWATYAGPRIHS
jgi:hypothetical protein